SRGGRASRHRPVDARSLSRRKSREPVPGLLPEERFVQKLPKPLVGGDRYQDPIPERREAVWDEIKPAAPDRREHTEIDEGTVAGEEIEQAEEEQQFRKYRIETLCQRHEPEQIHRPEDRIEQRRQHRAADKEHKAEEAERSGRAQQVERLPGVNQESLHVALHPPRALPDPIPDMTGRLF